MKNEYVKHIATHEQMQTKTNNENTQFFIFEFRNSFVLREMVWRSKTGGGGEGRNHNNNESNNVCKKLETNNGSRQEGGVRSIWRESNPKQNKTNWNKQAVHSMLQVHCMLKLTGMMFAIAQETMAHA